MEYEFEIRGKLPGINDLISAERTNRYAGAKLKAEAQNTCVLAIKKQLRGLRVEKPIIIHYMFFELNFRRDLDNISGFAHKVIQDALVKTGVIKDDGWKNVKGFTDVFAVDRANPRIVVLLEVLDG